MTASSLEVAVACLLLDVSMTNLRALEKDREQDRRPGYTAVVPREALREVVQVLKRDHPHLWEKVLSSRKAQEARMREERAARRAAAEAERAALGIGS